MPQWEYSKLAFHDALILYTTYEANGPRTIQKVYDDLLWSWCLNTLGLLHWEATGTISINGGGVAWYFKRMIDPYNQPLPL